jgi:hypothetical protein
MAAAKDGSAELVLKTPGCGTAITRGGEAMTVVFGIRTFTSVVVNSASTEPKAILSLSSRVTMMILFPRTVVPLAD